MRLLETMRAQTQNGVWEVPLLRRHLDRLRASAHAWGYEFSEARARAEVEQAVARQQDDVSTLRVRLTLGLNDVRASASPLVGSPFQTVWLCSDPLREAGGPLCVHKTTDRDHYETPYLAALAQGADEAILINAHGEIVEGTRTSVWVRRGRELLTPPLSAGGLPGVARSLMLDTVPDTREAVLTPADLVGAEALYVSNALRGLARVRLVGAESVPGASE